jgi:LysM repeat protein
MESLRQISAGFFLAVLSLFVVLGGFSLASIQGGMPASVPPVSTLPPAASAPIAFSTIPVLTGTPQVNTTDIATLGPLPTATEAPSMTPPPTPASCIPPAGWIAVLVQPNDSLLTLAQDYLTSTNSIKQGNCLFSDQLVSGSLLYLPPKPLATAVSCGAPPGWVSYQVINGDTLYALSLRYRLSVAELQRANCLGTSTYIQAGKSIKVPFVPTSTFTSSATSSPTLTLVPEPTTVVPPTSISPTAMPTETPTQTSPPPPPTATETVTVTLTPVP